MTDKYLVLHSDINDAEKISVLENKIFSDPWSYDSILSSFSSSVVKVYKIEDLNKIIAYMFTMTFDDSAEILNIAVDNDYRRLGLASKLINEFQEKLSSDVNKIYLEVRESNLAAKELYKKIGFYEIGIRRNYYKNPTENAILMVKTIRTV